MKNNTQSYTRILAFIAISIFFFYMFSCGPCTKSTNCYNSPSGLISLWSGNGNTNDTKGNNHGVFQSGNQAFGPGHIGQSFSFNGNNNGNFGGGNDYINVQANTAHDFGPNNFTIELWINATSFNSENTFVAKADFSTGWVFVYHQPSNTFRFYHTNAPGLQNFVQATITSGTLNVNTWYHIAVTRIGTVVTFYVDGTALTTNQPLVLNQVFNGTGNGNFHDLTIGAYDPLSTANSTVHGWFNGFLDEVCIYNLGLTQNQILVIYQAGTEPKC